MSNNWYRQAMPKVKDVLPHLPDITQKASSIKGVSSILLWGSLAKYANKPNEIIKDIDLIAVTDFHSEDLISIIDDEHSPFKLASANLEDEGFDPATVKFTKDFLTIKEYNVDHWAISKDKKLLHWGMVFDKREGWDKIKIDAEKYVLSITKIKREDLHKTSQTNKNRWSKLYDDHINRFLLDTKAPSGWYLSSENLKDILPETKKLS